MSFIDVIDTRYSMKPVSALRGCNKYKHSHSQGNKVGNEDNCVINYSYAYCDEGQSGRVDTADVSLMRAPS